jgi:hypothetical protein
MAYCTCDYDDGEFGGMKIGRGNRSTRRKRAPESLCPPQIPLDQAQPTTLRRAPMILSVARLYSVEWYSDTSDEL